MVDPLQFDSLEEEKLGAAKCADGMAGEYPCKNVDLLSFLSLRARASPAACCAVVLERAVPCCSGAVRCNMVRALQCASSPHSTLPYRPTAQY